MILVVGWSGPSTRSLSARVASNSGIARRDKGHQVGHHPIAAHDAVLNGRLRRAVSTGTYCSYTPDPTSPIE